jgi:PAS domain S-box-containing protein
MCGYAPGSVEPSVELFMGHVHPEDRNKYANAMAQAIASHAPMYLEHRLIRADGAERTVTEYAQFTFDSEGRLLRINGATQDVSETKQAEKALREAEERLRLALEGGDQGIWDVDMKTDTMTWDERAKGIFGVAPDAPVTSVWHIQQIHPDDRLRVLNAAAAAVANRTTFAEEYRTVLPRRDNQVGSLPGPGPLRRKGGPLSDDRDPA